MEKCLIILPTKSRPPLSIPSYSASQFEFIASTRVHANSNYVSMSIRSLPYPKFMDAQLNQLCSNGPLSDAVAILDSLAEQGSKVRPITYMNLLQSCIDRDCIEVGRELHARIGLVGNVNPFVETKLVSMYSKCGHLSEARKVFDEMRERNLFTWSAMIGACSREKSWEEVVDLFYDMVRHGFLPDEFLLPKILQACGKCGDLETGRLIHSVAIRHGMCSSIRVNNSIMAVYAKCGEMGFAKKLFKSMDERDSVTWNAIITGFCQNGDIEQARKYFDAMQEEGVEPGLVTWNILIASYNQLGRCDIAMDLMRKMESFGLTPDVYTWSSMISGFTQKGRTYHALDLLRKMLLSGVEPNSITVASAASACASLQSLSMALEIHGIGVKMSLVDDVLTGNSLIDMYSKCGDLEAAQRIFDMMYERDVYSWNTIIGGYCHAGFCGKAYELFMKMQDSDSPPNVVTWNALITGYMQSGAEDQALDLFKRIEKDGKIKRNVASWNSLIAGFLQSGQKDKAMQIFRRMQFFQIAPNSVTVLSILPAFANLVAGKKVKEIHCCALRRNLVSEISVSNILVEHYAKSGNLMYSRRIFDGLPLKDIISWNIMLSGYVLHGSSESALDLFYQMRKEGLQPTRGTFASIILAYSHAGMVDEGTRIFSSITEEYQIRPGLEHYSATVYLLGRSGKLAEALEFIQNMPVSPNFSVWHTLLTACRVHRNFRLAILAAELALEMLLAIFMLARNATCV
ncbi:LOW QUALITY PROTEIN: pentatricopeptide repeat-containing protein At1g19720-like [Lotus japonicus]|uniref:LOW QUALITY PROTEIN: pentatricopeptide repeat-containing protein At1g19720-like n=1 Tax=Lotus japonicus TaxID=34305 RepID=UPI0025899249|nr:LOW QUALITY PROTEIN: pentatricopeptide repeat-containing protein At1g19720-like [Lotus japonicus]